jgi:hypothetical protein
MRRRSMAIVTRGKGMPELAQRRVPGAENPSINGILQPD